MAWLQVHLLTDRTHAETLEAALEGLGALAVSFEDAQDEPVLEPDPGTSPLWSNTLVTGLFPAELAESELRAQVVGGVPAELLHDLRIERLEDRLARRLPSHAVR